MKKLFAIATLCAGFGAAPALGILGVGDIVYDPGNNLELVLILGQMEREYSKLSQTYNQIVSNARMITSKARWRSVLTPWSYPGATNTYGTTGGWIAALNTGQRSLAGYQQAVTPIRNYSSVWGSMDSSHQDQVGRNYATVELSDGVTVNALDQLGALRANSAAVENSIDTLESDSLSDSDALNTEVGVLNKINAGGMISVRTSQDTNKLLASILDHQMVEAKAHRDAEAQSINDDVALQEIAPVVDAQHLTGATAVLTIYRLP